MAAAQKAGVTLRQSYARVGKAAERAEGRPSLDSMSRLLLQVRFLVTAVPELPL